MSMELGEVRAMLFSLSRGHTAGVSGWKMPQKLDIGSPVS